MSNGAPPPIPGTAPAKKGLSPWAWIAIGCGGLVVVGFIVIMALTMFVFNKGKELVTEATGSESFQELVEGLQDNPLKTAAEIAVNANPELDLITTDDEAGTMTFRNNKTGEEATLNFADIAEGRLSVSTSEGEYSLDASDSGEGGVTLKGPEGETRLGTSANLGDVPDWVPVYPGASETQSAFHTTTGDSMMGALSSKTGDNAQQVVDHYTELFEEQGYTIGTQSMTKTSDGALGIVSAELPDGRSLNVMATQDKNAETTVAINYNVKQQ